MMLKTGYQRYIREKLDRMGVDPPAHAIEELMRVSNGGTLDHLDREAFDAAVELAAAVWSVLDDEQRQFYSM